MERRTTAVACAFALLSVAVPSVAGAQAEPGPEGVVVGAWTFRPLVEMLVRGEYRRAPADIGGDVYQSSAVLADAAGTNVPPVVTTRSKADDEWGVGERARLGLSVDRGPVSAGVTLQDSRLWGTRDGVETVGVDPPAFGPYEAWLDVHTTKGRKAFFRLGRQRVVWGDGRLIGASDFSLTPRSLDAARAGVRLGNIDVEALAAVLSPPGRRTNVLATPSGGTTPVEVDGSGAQLYGLDATWRFVPLFGVELTALARFAREPRPIDLTPSDTYVLDARVFGEHRGLRYAVEAAYELGRVASFGDNRDLRAFAGAARVELATALAGKPTFGLVGSYATGDDGPAGPSQTLRRFDPILPETHEVHGKMELYGWSNLIEAGARVGLRPIAELEASAEYRLVALAEPSGRWSNASLVPVGAAPDNDARMLGHEVDITLGIAPWDPVRFATGYGLFVFAEGAKAILVATSRCETEGTECVAPSVQSWAFVQAIVRAP